MKKLVIFAMIISTFIGFKLSNANIIPSNIGHGPECSGIREGRTVLDKLEQHSGPCLFQGGIMETALRINQTGLETGKKKDYVSSYSASEPKYGVLFTDFIYKMVAQKQRRMSGSYKENYQTLLFQLNNFIKDNDVILYTNSITEEFLDDFIMYLEDKGYKHNYVDHILTMCKAMVKKAGLNNYAIDPSYMNVELDKEDTFSIYLSTIDISRIYYFDKLTRIETKTKDLFVVGCLTALRYSDYSTLTKSNIDGETIVKVTKKTGVKVHIPMHDILKEIITKYDGFPAGTTTQNFNREIRKICKKIGFTDPVTYTCTKGGQLISITKPKYELIRSHTARRSAATNMILAGMQPFQVMAITGHKSEKCFFKYVKLTREQIARQISGNNYFRK